MWLSFMPRCDTILLTLSRQGFLQIGMAAGGGGGWADFCLSSPIDLKFAI